MTEQEVPEGTVGDTASETDAAAAEPDGNQESDGDGADVKDATEPEASEG